MSLVSICIYIFLENQKGNQMPPLPKRIPETRFDRVTSEL